MKYSAEYEYYDEKYLNDLVLNFKHKDSKIFLTLIPEEILEAKKLKGLVGDEISSQVAFLKKNNIIPYVSLNFSSGIYTGVPEISYNGPKKMLSALEEPFRSCVEPKNFVGQKWHSINLSEFSNSNRFRNNVKYFLDNGYITSSFYSEIYRDGNEVANVSGHLGKIKVNSNMVLEGIIKTPKGSIER